ncbi:MAG: HlyD family efflux transporter periplasmic adaptor subunit [Magnetococcales bacterium]|nr:HlyD family efflux transporter periplasmic adaptor subunit [Magnetococcales bacterium]
MAVQGEKLILGLSALLQLGKRAFASEDEAAFGFLVVNETHLMTPYRQAALWRHAEYKTGEVVALSGSPDPSTRAPYVAWLTRLFSLEKLTKQKTPLCLTSADLPGEDGEAWEQWLPAHAVWAPLTTGLGNRMGGMLLVKSVPWTDPELKLLAKLADAYANAWELVRKRAQTKGIPWKRILIEQKGRTHLGVALVLFMLCWVPVRESALAPATVVPRHPTPVRSPLEGVVERLHVEPNQPVRAGDLLFTMDEAVLENKLEVEQRAGAMLQEEYLQILKQAVTNPESRAQKRILEKRIDKQAAESNGVRLLLQRTRVTAPADGVAILTDANHWRGKPVMIGERILEIADPMAAELEIRLPVNDAIAFGNGAGVTLYPNMDPLATWTGTVIRIGYEPQEMEGVLSYAIRASFSGSVEPPRIGLRGTAKIQGERTTLFYYLFRHPLSLLRQRLGL